MVYQVNHNHVLWYMFKTTIRWMLGKVLCIIMVKSKIKNLLAQVNAKQSCRQKKRQCWILMYWEIIITYLWFLKSTVGNNTSIKKILASIKYWPNADFIPHEIGNFMPTYYIPNLEGCRSSFYSYKNWLHLLTWLYIKQIFGIVWYSPCSKTNQP